MFVAFIVVAALMTGAEYHRTDGFTNTPESRREMRAERMEDQPIGEYPAELSLEVAKQVAETAR